MPFLNATRPLFLWIIFILLMPSHTFAQKPLAADRQIKAAYASYVSYYDNKDLLGLLTIFAPDFHFTETNGSSRDVAFFKRALQEDFEATKSVHNHKLEIHNLSVSGSKASAQVTETRRWTAEYERGSRHTYQETTISQDTWVFRENQWKMQSSRWITDRIIKDGTPIDVTGPLQAHTPMLSIRVLVLTIFGIILVLSIILTCYVAKSVVKARRHSGPS